MNNNTIRQIEDDIQESKACYVPLGEIVAGTVCFTHEKHFALEIIKQDPSNNETIIKLLDNLLPQYKGQEYYTRSASELVLVPSNVADLEFLIAPKIADSKIRVLIPTNEKDIQKRVKRKPKEKINFEEIPEVVSNTVDEKEVEIIENLKNAGATNIHMVRSSVVADIVEEGKVVGYTDEMLEADLKKNSEQLGIMEAAAIEEHEAGLTIEFPVVEYDDDDDFDAVESVRVMPGSIKSS